MDVSELDTLARLVSSFHESFFFLPPLILTLSINKGAGYTQMFTARGNTAASSAHNLVLPVDIRQIPHHAYGEHVFSPTSTIEPGNSPQNGIFGSDYASVSLSTDRPEKQYQPILYL